MSLFPCFVWEQGCFPGLIWVAFAAAFFCSGIQAMGQEDLEGLEQAAIKAAVAQVAPSVVRIETLGGLEQVGRLLVGTGPTTGLAVSEDGYLISSAFNFVQKPASILVSMPSGKRAAAQIVARDSSRMLVLLRVRSDEKLHVPQFVPRDEMEVGQWAIAIGRTYEGGMPNISAGVISARSRIWGKAIQTDAKISPSNYGGPLVDIRGRVLGVLVPLSPQSQGEVAGAEWYDSGIGFAIPLADVMPQLEKMKRGENLHPGLLGITMKGKDMYANPAEIAACQPKSPASKAGLKAGDRIVAVDGEEIGRQVHLKHAIGQRYAGQQVQLVAMRGDQRLEMTVELTDKLEPYENPFLGVLPVRSPQSDPGIVVRYVYPDSPAAKAGIQRGDRILALADEEIVDLNAAFEVLGNHEPGEDMSVRLERDGKPEDLTVRLSHLPTAIPDDLPSARKSTDSAEDERPAVGEVEIKLPEERNDCLAYVPEDYDPNVAYGVIVWLHEPGEFDRDELIKRWKPRCGSQDLILLAPQSADPKRWVATEIGFVRKTIDDIVAKYNIDPTRIVTHGYQAGGAMAYLTAFAHRDRVRAVAAVDAAVPTRVRIPANDPIRRLAIHTTFTKKSKVIDRIEANIEGFRERKYPVIPKQHDGEPRYLNDSELAELVRWIDTLDRL